MDKKELMRMAGFREDFDPANKVIKKDKVEFEGKNYVVSTVDLGIDHQWHEGPPIYWETMIFELEEDGSFGQYAYQDQYHSKESAEFSHDRITRLFAEGKAKLDCGYFDFD